MTGRGIPQWVLQAAGGVLLVVSFSGRLHGLREWLQAGAFLAGAGGMLYLFRRWRGRGDLLARNVCVAAFGVWGIGVVVAGSGRQGAAMAVAGAALLLGAVGAVAVAVLRKVRS